MASKFTELAIECADPGGPGLGARHADVGQGDASWVVLADPEGNEFCVLADRRP